MINIQDFEITLFDFNRHGTYIWDIYKPGTDYASFKKPNGQDIRISNCSAFIGHWYLS